MGHYLYRMSAVEATVKISAAKLLCFGNEMHQYLDYIKTTCLKNSSLPDLIKVLAPLHANVHRPVGPKVTARSATYAAHAFSTPIDFMVACVNRPAVETPTQSCDPPTLSQTDFPLETLAAPDQNKKLNNSILASVARSAGIKPLEVVPGGENSCRILAS